MCPRPLWRRRDGRRAEPARGAGTLLRHGLNSPALGPPAGAAPRCEWRVGEPSIERNRIAERDMLDFVRLTNCSCVLPV